MSSLISRRSFTVLAAGLAASSAGCAQLSREKTAAEPPKPPVPPPPTPSIKIPRSGHASHLGAM